MHNSAQSLKKQASSLYQAGRLPESGAAYTQLCTRFPHDPETWSMLGVIKGRLGATREAERHLRHALELDPHYAPAWSNLGTLMQHNGRLDDAAACFRRALSINPADAIAGNNLGTVLREQGKLAEAMECYRTAIRLKPRYAQAHNNLGTALHEQCRTRDAIESYRKALKAEPRFAQAHYNLGVSLQSDGTHQQALYHYEKALEIAPDLVDAVAAIARMHEKEGRFDDARKQLEPYLDARPPASIAVAYAILSRHTQDQQRAATLLEEALPQASLSPIQRQEMEFMLGDLYDDLGEYDRAFHHYQTANSLRPGRFDATAYQAQIEAIAQEVDHQLVARLGSVADAGDRPIFIVGMPRSGTSLIEQILASHPDVHGAGELPHLGALVHELQQQAHTPYPHVLADMSPDGARDIGRKYLKLLDGISKTARFVTDKMPHNFLFLGLISAALPGAKVIHCIRNPMDTCLSIYFHNFNSNHPYSNDLQDLGRYYQGYMALMEHWREVLGTRLFEVKYEDLIANQQQQTEELLAFCDLGWNDACLDFHKNRRIVNTPSYGQVRKPIYHSSVERWRNYEAHITPLKNALGLT